MRQIVVETDEQFAPCCFIICLVDKQGNWDTRDEANTVLVQSDRDYPGLARTLGGTIADYEIEKTIDYILENLGKLMKFQTI